MQYDLIPEAKWYRVLRKIDKDGHVGLKFSGFQLETTLRKHIIGELQKFIQLLFLCLSIQLSKSLSRVLSYFETF